MGKRLGGPLKLYKALRAYPKDTVTQLAPGSYPTVSQLHRVWPVARSSNRIEEGGIFCQCYVRLRQV